MLYMYFQSLTYTLATTYESQLLATDFFLVAAFLQEDLVHISSLLLILGPHPTRGLKSPRDKSNGGV